jgi:Flp pilus assembly protein TadG
MTCFRRIRRENSGAAAAEMALVLPLLITVLFGSFEIGHFFYSAHIANKGVRDGARYAARQNFTLLGCGPSVADGPTDIRIKEVTRTGQPANGTPRIFGWDNGEVTVTVTCTTTGSFATAGIYTGLIGGARKVEVSAAVPYPSLFRYIGINSSALTINARSEAAVMGI